MKRCYRKISALCFAGLCLFTIAGCKKKEKLDENGSTPIAEGINTVKANYDHIDYDNQLHLEWGVGFEIHVPLSLEGSVYKSLVEDGDKEVTGVISLAENDYNFTELRVSKKYSDMDLSGLDGDDFAYVSYDDENTDSSEDMNSSEEIDEDKVLATRNLIMDDIDEGFLNFQVHENNEFVVYSWRIQEVAYALIQKLN